MQDESAKPNRDAHGRSSELFTAVKAFSAHSSIPQLVHTADGRMLLVNQAFTDITGYTLQDIPDAVAFMVRARRFTRAAAEAAVAALTPQFLSPEPPAPREAVIYTKQGQQRHWLFHVAAVFEDEQGRRCVLSSVVDVTEHKTAEAQLKSQVEFVERIFRTHPNALYVYDLEQQRPVFQNRHIGEEIGYSAGEVQAMGADLLQLITHPEDIVKFHEQIGRLAQAADNEIISFEYRLRAKDGSWRWLVSHDTVFKRDESGKVIQMLGTATDITEAKRAHQERLEMTQHMQELQKMESLAMLAGGIAHDFNNLLVGIMGSADLAMMQLPERSPATEDLERIQTTAVECAELCKQLLAYAGKGKFVVEPFFLTDVIEQIGQLLQISISKKVALRYEFAQGVPAIEGDTRQLRQVIMNLIRNASDAIGDQPGVITVLLGVVDADQEYLAGAVLGDDLEPGRYVTLEVSDTGCGIDSEAMARIFDPFYSSKREGRGLGLAAVRGIIKSHGGAIRVYSEPKRGSSFKILLPASDTSVDTGQRAQDLAPTPNPGGSVLVVDDEDTVRSVAARSLSMLGFSVLHAADGHEALEVFRQHQREISVVLLDMMMPGLAGAETFQELRRLDPHLSVVLMSGYNEHEATNAFTGKGLAGFIQKPFRHADLARIINAAIQRARKPN